MRASELELPKGVKVYLDMDGVLANFFEEYAKLAGVKSYRDVPPAKVDPTLDKMVGTDFFARLPKFPVTDKIIDISVQAAGSYGIISSPLRNDFANSEKHKREWIKKHLNPQPTEIFITPNKEKHAVNPDGTPNVLIDDRGSNITAWENAGGIGVKFQADEDSLKKILDGLNRARRIGTGKEKLEPQNLKSRDLGKMIASKDDEVEENFADGRKFVEPNFSNEWEEAERYPEFQKIGKDAWIKLAKKGKSFTIKSAKGINNTDAADPDSFKELDPAKQKRALAQLEKGTIEMPIVAVYSDGHKELVGGNTRLTAMMAKDGQATVWAFKVPDEVAELAENFADGKKKGKSRPGRVKKSGASCNGSVTSLRAKAKKYSGERAKMYHWCANMKGGKGK